MNPQLTIEDPPAIDEALDRASRMGLYPPAAARIQAVAADARSSLDDLERAVAADPPLGARILRVANSPLYGQTRRVATLRDALRLLGAEQTRDIALALAMLSLGRRTCPARAVQQRHALATAVASRRLMLTQGSAGASEGFVAGLLHDIGSIILLELHGDDHAALLDAHAGDGLDLVVAEQARYGFHHGAIGAACLQRWNLPLRVCLAVRHHHLPEALTTPEVARARHLAAVVHVADRLVRDRERDADPAASSEEVVAAEAVHCERLALGADDLEGVLAAVDEDLRAFAG